MFNSSLMLAITVLILAVVVAYLAFNAIFVHMQIKELWHEISNLNRKEA